MRPQNQKNMTHLNEDWEHESKKDIVYLLEERMLMEKEYREWLLDNRKPALLRVIDEDKTLENEKFEPNILPF
jgi:hypothetical protein